MKLRTVTAILLCLASGFTALSAEVFPLSVGPFISAKFGINGNDTPYGRKNGLAFCNLPDLGVNFWMPLSSASNLGISLDAAFSSYAYKIKRVADSREFTHRYKYITINPQFTFSGFNLGLSLGVPVSGEYNGVEIKKSALATVSEVTVGGAVPVFSDESGRMCIIMKGSYMLSGIYSDYAKNDPLSSLIPAEAPQKITGYFNPRAAAVSVGFSYMFNLSNPAPADQVE